MSRWGEVLAEMRSFLARRGLRNTLRAVRRMALYGHAHMIIVKSTLAGPPFDPGADGLVFREATADDLARLETLGPSIRADRLRAFVREDGEWLHVARDGARIVGFRRVSRNLSPRGIIGRVLPLRSDQLYTQDLFVHPDYRNRSVARRLSLAQERALAACGFTELLSSIDVDNVASLRMALRRGSRPVCAVYYRRVLSYCRCEVSPALPAEVQCLVDEVAADQDRRDRVAATVAAARHNSREVPGPER